MNTIRPYTNMAKFGSELVELAWCHDAIADAINMYRHLTGKTVSMEELVDQRMQRDGIAALFYGALNAAAPIAANEFLRSWQKNVSNMRELTEIMLAVIDGVANYWPTPEKQVEDTEYDMLWPQVEEEEKEREPFFLLPFQLELMRYGFTVRDIGRMTMRGMIAVLDIVRGVEKVDVEDVFGSGTGVV